MNESKGEWASVSPHLGPSAPAPPRLRVLTMTSVRAWPSSLLTSSWALTPLFLSTTGLNWDWYFWGSEWVFFRDFWIPLTFSYKPLSFFLLGTLHYLYWKDFSFEMPFGVLSGHWCKWDLNVKKFALKAANFRRGRHLFYISRNICFQHQRVHTQAYSSPKGQPRILEAESWPDSLMSVPRLWHKTSCYQDSGFRVTAS